MKERYILFVDNGRWTIARGEQSEGDRYAFYTAVAVCSGKVEASGVLEALRGEAKHEQQ